MNYNHDTEMDLDWAADQLRRKKNMGCGLPDTPIRRVTASLPQTTLTSPLQAAGGGAIVQRADTTLGSALSALAINAQSGDQCRSICDNLLVLMSDRDRSIGLHAEFVQLKGEEALLSVLRQHGGDIALSALRVLDKLSRTSAREISAAGGVDILVRICEKTGQAPRILEAALRALHGLTFDEGAKVLLQRRGVRELAEGLVESKLGLPDLQGASNAAEEERATIQAWGDVHTISTRLLQRLGGSGKKPFPRRV